MQRSADADVAARSCTTANDMLRAAARDLISGIQRSGALPHGAIQNRAVRSLLKQVHRDVMQVVADATTAAPDELADVASAVRRLVPAGIENPLSIRERVFVRLLRAGALEPAWTLAEDNSAGVVRAARPGMRWAGGNETHMALPLPSLVEGGAVYAWLPGFRDPRWGVPDSVYDMTTAIQLRVILEQVSLERGRIRVGGSAHFGLLEARADDDVMVVLRAPDGEERRVLAERVRTPRFVRRSGPDLTRLAWAGWQAAIEPSALAGPQRDWSMSLELTRPGLSREEPLGLDRGKCAKEIGECGPTEGQGQVARLSSDEDGQLSVTVTPLGPSARVLPRELRTAARRFIPRR